MNQFLPVRPETLAPGSSQQALRGLRLCTAEPSHIWSRVIQVTSDGGLHQDLKNGIWTRTRSPEGGLR